MYSIRPRMTFFEIFRYYRSYAKEAKKHGRKPISLLRFITCRY